MLEVLEKQKQKTYFDGVHKTAIIDPDIQLGENVTIRSEGFGYVTKNKRHYKTPQVCTVIIENDVEIGANVTIDRATIGQTKIGKNSKIDNQIQIGYNVIIGESVIISGQSGVAGSTTLGNFVIVAGDVKIADHLTIGDSAILLGSSKVMQDVKEKEILWGYPAIPSKNYIKSHMLFKNLPSIYKDIQRLKKLL